jgi:hypothetical protein
MIDLNHGSGCQYEAPSRPPGIAVAINVAIDAALRARDRAQSPRRYVSTSGLGRECLRQIQYDYLGFRRTRVASSNPRRSASSKPATAPRTSWPPGCARLGSTCTRNAPMADSLGSRLSMVGSEVTSTAASLVVRSRWPFLPYGRTRRLAQRSGRSWSRRASCSRGRSMQRKSRSTRLISICQTRRYSPRSIATRSSSTVSWCPSMRLSAARQRSRR